MTFGFVDAGRFSVGSDFWAPRADFRPSCAGLALSSLVASVTTAFPPVEGKPAFTAHRSSSCRSESHDRIIARGLGLDLVGGTELTLPATQNNAFVRPVNVVQQDHAIRSEQMAADWKQAIAPTSG